MKKYFPLILILFLGTLLRFYHNLDISLWHDEAFSALMIRYPWQEMFYRLGLDVHPPMYYIFLRFWHYVFGDSLLSLRGFSILFSVGSIWSGWLFTKEAFRNEKAALWAALFIAINPFQLQYVTEARMYTFGAFFALLAGYFLVKALNSQKQVYEAEQKNMPNLPETMSAKKCMWWSYVGFTLCMIIIIYTHYYLFFTAAALGFYGLLYLIFHHEGADKSARYTWNKFVPLLLSFIVIVLSFLPWLKTFLFQYKQVQAGYWIQMMDRWSIPSTFWDMLLGFERDTTKGTTQIFLVLVTLFSIWMFYRFLKKTEGFHKWLVALAVVAPFAGAILFAILAHLKGSSSSVYLDRYFLFASVYYSVALAVWMKEIKIKELSQIFFIIYIILNLVAYVHYWQQLNVSTKPGMAGAAKFLHANVENSPSQHVFVDSSFEFFNYKYYALTGLPIPTTPLLYTNNRPYTYQISHVEGVALLSDSDLLPSFSAAVHPGDTVWVLWTNAFGGTDNPSDIPQNWTRVDKQAYPDVRPYPGAVIYVGEYKVN
jgi:uncharacterized membrane protein